MKKFFWLCGGYPSLEASDEIIDAYMDGGCDGIEWTIPPQDPYKDQSHLKERILKARENCPDCKKHLERMAKFKRKYSEAEVFPAIYEESVNEIGIEYLKHFCKENKIDTLFLIGDFEDEKLREIKNSGLKVATSVTYYFTGEEIKRVLQNNGFIYMQAFPYEAEIKAGFTTDRLQECINSLHTMGIQRPIYCAKGIKKPADIALISQSKADGYILGSSLMDYYGNLKELTNIVSRFQK